MKLTPAIVDDALPPDAWERIVLTLAQAYDEADGAEPAALETFKTECEGNPEIYKMMLGLVLVVVDAYLNELDEEVEDDEDDVYDSADEGDEV